MKKWLIFIHGILVGLILSLVVTLTAWATCGPLVEYTWVKWCNVPEQAVDSLQSLKVVLWSENDDILVIHIMPHIREYILLNVDRLEVVQGRASFWRKVLR